MIRIAYAFNDLEFDGGSRPPEQCEWSAHCSEQATHMVEHPELEWVPACYEHTMFATDN